MNLRIVNIDIFLLKIEDMQVSILSLLNLDHVYLKRVRVMKYRSLFLVYAFLSISYFMYFFFMQMIETVEKEQVRAIFILKVKTIYTIVNVLYS